MDTDKLPTRVAILIMDIWVGNPASNNQANLNLPVEYVKLVARWRSAKRRGLELLEERLR